MAVAYTFQANFESGDASEWDSETDTAAQLDFPHYSELARFPWATCTPFSGAYCMRAVMSGGTADAFVTEGDLNVAAAGTAYHSFNIWISPDFTGTADDTINLLELQETGNAAMVTFGMRIVAATDVINFGIGKAAPTAWGAAEIERGVHYTVDLAVTLDDGGSNDGTIDVYVTRIESEANTDIFAAQVASLDQTAVTHGVLGVQGHLATTTGTILFDNFIQDGSRVYAQTNRFNETLVLLKSGHVFVGRGCIDNITLLSGNGTDNVVRVYDTDTANTNDQSRLKIELKNTAANETVDPAGVPVKCQYGAYVELSGTTPHALVKIKNVSAFGSDAAIKMQGLRR